MKEYICLIFLLLSSFGLQAKCTFDNSNAATPVVNLDMTTGVAVVKLNINATGNIKCNANSDNLYYATPLQDYIVAFQGSSGNRVLIKINLTGDGFPVSIGNRTVSAGEILNDKVFTVTASYVNSGTAKQTVSGNAFNLSDPAVSITSDNTCTSNWLSYINFTVTHKPTNCRFSESTYKIQMPETTLNDIVGTTNTKSGTANLVLNCDSVYNVTTNPVSFIVSRGDWNESGTILKNTFINGAKGVGFQIYNGTATTPLRRGDILMNRIVKMAAISNQYTFPIIAKYVRVAEEPLQPGEMQSKVIFAVSYD